MFLKVQLKVSWSDKIIVDFFNKGNWDRKLATFTTYDVIMCALYITAHKIFWEPCNQYVLYQSYIIKFMAKLDSGWELDFQIIAPVV